MGEGTWRAPMEGGSPKRLIGGGTRKDGRAVTRLRGFAELLKRCLPLARHPATAPPRYRVTATLSASPFVPGTIDIATRRASRVVRKAYTAASNAASPAMLPAAAAP